MTDEDQHDETRVGSELVGEAWSIVHPGADTMLCGHDSLEPKVPVKFSAFKALGWSLPWDGSVSMTDTCDVRRTYIRNHNTTCWPLNQRVKAAMSVGLRHAQHGSCVPPIENYKGAY